VYFGLDYKELNGKTGVVQMPTGQIANSARTQNLVPRVLEGGWRIKVKAGEPI
jgi:hypothetical protein